MKKTYFSIFFVISIVLFMGAACNNADTNLSGAYVGGVSGLDLSFVESEPPAEVLDDNSEGFSISVLLKNIGEYDIGIGKIKTTLSGINIADFQIQDATKVSENLLDGVKKDGNDKIPGGEEQIIYDAKYKPDLNQDFDTGIKASICYQYGTKTLTKLCLLKDPTRRATAGDVCNVKSEKIVQNSGAPVHIISLIETPSGKDSIRITFDVENIGSGIVYSRNAFDSGDCLNKEDGKDYVHVKVLPTGNLRVQCAKLNNANEGDVRLMTDGKASVTCEIDTSNLQDLPYENPVNINLEYYYYNYITQNFKVVNAI
jgi:hypothetical protein